MVFQMYFYFPNKNVKRFVINLKRLINNIQIISEFCMKNYLFVEVTYEKKNILWSFSQFYILANPISSHLTENLFCLSSLESFQNYNDINISTAFYFLSILFLPISNNSFLLIGWWWETFCDMNADGAGKGTTFFFYPFNYTIFCRYVFFVMFYIFTKLSLGQFSL